MPTTIDEQVKEFMRTGVISDDKGRHVPGAATCQKCAKLFARTGVYTGMVKAQDILCPSCLEKTKGAAYLVCGKCGMYMGEYKPGITPEEKYEVEPGETLHLNCCPHCNPDAGTAHVVEFKEFMDWKLKNAPKPEAQKDKENAKLERQA